MGIRKKEEKWPVAPPLLSCSRVKTDGGEMADWVPVLIVAIVVVCATANLLLSPKLRPPRKAR